MKFLKTIIFLLIILAIFLVIISVFKINIFELNKNTVDSFTVAFVGDQGIGSDSRKVLQIVKKEKSDAIVLLGDFDYLDNAKGFISMLEGELGKKFPIIPIIGNHDQNKWSDYLRLFKKHLIQTPSVNCDGDLGIKSFCKFKQLKIYTIAPGEESLNVENKVYADFIENEAKNAGSDNRDFWNLCAWHKNQVTMQVGEKTNETGWEVYDTCLKYGFPIITAHEHSYSRSFLMSDMSKQALAKKDFITISTSTSFLKNTNIDLLKIGPGYSFVVVSGLGGKSIRKQFLKNEIWSSVYTQNQGAKYGALFCIFNYLSDDRKTLCYFKNIDGEVIDAFMVER